MARTIDADLIRELCDLVRKLLPEVLHDLFDELDHELSDHAVHVSSNQSANSLLGFRGECRLRAQPVAEQLVITLCRHLPEGHAGLQAVVENSSQWSLVDDDEVADLLDAKRLVRALRESIGQLEWLVCASLDTVSGLEPREADHPLSLEFMLRRLQEGLNMRQQPLEVRVVFQQAAEKVLSRKLPDYFNALLEAFRRRKVEPKQPQATPGRRPPAEPATTLQARRAKPYAAFHQLLEIPPGAPGVGAAQAVKASAETSLRRAFSSLQAHLADMPALAGMPVSAHSLHQGFSRVQSRGAAAHLDAGQWLRELEAEGCNLSVRQREDALLVGELFSTLGNEQRIAEALKPALQSLLPVVLQGALQDPVAFADPDHPLRGTLDKVLKLADNCDPPNRALEAQVQQIIASIAQNYQGDVQAFVEQNPALDQLLEVQQRSAQTNAERVIQLHRGHDTLKSARRQVNQALQELQDGQTPQSLLDWLDAGWRELLVHELVRKGEGSFAWRADLALIGLLRRKLMAVALAAPGEVQAGPEEENLLALLKRGMDNFHSGQYRHLDVLARLGRQLHGEEPAVLVEVPKQAAEEVQDTPLELRWRERVAGFKIGERLLDANGRHLQLIWRSPNQDHFVLVDGQGREAGSYGGTQLGQFLASGQLQMVGSDSGPSLLQSTLQDIVGRLYNEIAHARSHDELTGALNRRSFEVALAQCLAGREQNAFIMLHLGMFALLNRQLGSAAGDACLRALVEHLRSLLPEGAQIGRLAGVDFAICLPDSSSQAATELADSLMKTLEEKGFLWEGRRHPLSLSLGVLGSRNRHDVAGVLSDLHSATTAARESGGNALHVFEEDADAQYGDLLAIAARIDSIIEQQQLGLRLQQIAPTDPASEELPHYELLLVMENDLQLMDFINAAERYQRMPKVDRWVLKRVFLELERHPQVWQHSSSLSINLSGSSLNDDKLPGFIESLFEQHAVEPQKICFELTETSMVANLAKTADMMRYLQGLGCSFSIDDFGVGFSSFDYLKRLPADYVKIDGSFVRDIENSPGDLAMVRSINEIAHALGRKTVAEFVETPAIRQYLLELGVDYVQGYGVERPRPLGSWLSQ